MSRPVSGYRWAHLVRLLLVAAMLSGCGGGGPGSGTANDDVNGIWREPGTGTIGIISNGGWSVDIISNVYGHLQGRLLSSGGIIYDSVLSSFWAGQFLDVLFATQGTVIPKSAIDVSYDGQSTLPFSLALTYDLLSERTPSLALIAGIWSRTSGTYTVTLTIDNAGTLFGSDTDGCNYTGSASIPDARVNTYAIAMSRAGCNDYLQDGRGQGVLVDTAAANDTLIFAVARTREPSITDSISLELTRQ